MRATIRAEFDRPDLAIVNDDYWLARWRRSIYKPGGWVWRSDKVKWRMRPVMNEGQFLDEVLRAVQLANMARLQRVYDASVYRLGPASRLNRLVQEARIFSAGKPE